MARAEVGDDVYGEDPTVLALQERVADLFGHEAALFTPTGSMANVLAVAPWSRPAQEVLCESSAHIARAELGAHGAYQRDHHADLDRRPRPGRPARDRVHSYAPDMGPFFVRPPRVSVENTHNFAGGAVLPLDDLRELRALGGHHRHARSTSTAPGCGTRTSPPAPAGRLRPDRGRAGGLPVQGARRTDRLPDGRLAPTPSTRPGCAASGWAAACARWACSPRPGCTPSTTTSSGWPTTTRMPGCWPRRCGLDPADVDTNIVVVDRPRRRRPSSRRPPRRAYCVAAVGPRAVRWSPTSTSRGRRRAGRRGALSSMSARLSRKTGDGTHGQMDLRGLECRSRTAPSGFDFDGESLHEASAQDRLGAHRAGAGRSHAFAGRVVGRRRTGRCDLPATHELQTDRVQGPGRPQPLLRRHGRRRGRAVRAEDRPDGRSGELDGPSRCPPRPAAPSGSPCSAPR